MSRTLMHRHAWFVLTFVLASVNMATAESSTSKTIQASGLTMTGLRGIVAASTSMTVQASSLTMTGLRGTVAASTAIAVEAKGLTMTGLRP